MNLTYANSISTVSLIFSGITLLRSWLESKRKPKYEKFETDVSAPIMQAIQAINASTISFCQSIDLIFLSGSRSEGIKLIKKSRMNFSKNKVSFLFSLEEANDLSPRKTPGQSWSSLEDALDDFLDALSFFDQFDETGDVDNINLSNQDIKRKQKKIRSKWADFLCVVKRELHIERQCAGKIVICKKIAF